MTPLRLKALRYLREHPGAYAVDLAVHLWPDSPMHRRISNSGPSGAVRGKAAWLCAGSYLGALRKDGLVRLCWQYSDERRPRNRYELTAAGAEALDREAAPPVKETDDERV